MQEAENTVRMNTERERSENVLDCEEEDAEEENSPEGEPDREELFSRRPTSVTQSLNLAHAL